MLSDTELATLQTLADGGNMNYEQWPALLDSLVERLNEIARNEFPIIKRQPSPPRVESQAPDSSQTSNLNHIESSDSADKENAPPPVTASSNHVTESDDVLPRELLIRLNCVVKTLTTSFKTYPPHTVQRLSELILEPRRHYRNLPAYLHALDRVVNVTSGANIFPLPAAFPVANNPTINGGTASNSNSVAWGNSTSAQPSLGSDESLGGALLTPIPWLTNGNSDSASSGSRSGSRGPIEREVRTESTETIEGPNGAGSIETVTVSVYGSGIPNSQPVQENNRISSAISSLRAEGGVTQGELLRQEQELNLVPAAQVTGRLSDADGKSEEEEIPHARGPEEVGVEDMGPQTSHSMTQRAGVNVERHGIDVEAAVGRRADGEEHDQDEKDEVKKEVKDEEDTDMGVTNSSPAQTPKREAEEDLDGEREAKKIKNESADDGGGGLKEELEKPKREEDEELKKEEKEDEDAEMLLVDADGRAEGEKKVGEGNGSQVGVDAVDTPMAP